jgi:hypothetical protein
MCPESSESGAPAPVPDFAVTGFANTPNRLAEAHSRLKDLKALRLSVCVGASYNPSTNQICFHIPVYGDFCVRSPVQIPVGADLKACAETCGAIIPTGVKATIYLNGAAIYTGTIVGSC